MGDFETLRELLLVLLRLRGAEFFLKLQGKRGEIDLPEQFHDRLGAHHRLEGAVSISVLRFAEFDFGEELAKLERSVARLGDDVILVVDDALKLAGAHIEHEADA